jgi:hypothetical protein
MSDGNIKLIGYDDSSQPIDIFGEHYALKAPSMNFFFVIKPLK